MKTIIRFFNEKVEKKKALKVLAWFCAGLFLCGMISRGMYGAALPRVETEAPSYLNLTHQVKAEGRLKAERENAVYGTEGLRVDQILVQEGETVEQGQNLLQYDLKDLDEIIEERELELEKLQIQLDTLKVNQGITDAARNKAKERAGEDYRATGADNSFRAGAAQDNLNRARQALDSFPAKETYLAERGAVEGTVSGNELEAEWRQQKEALEQAVRENEQAAHEVASANEESLRQAKRALEDAMEAQTKDSSPALLELEIEVLEKELALYRELREEGGMLTSEYQGAVTRILIEESGRVPDGAVFFIADQENGYEFEAQISKEDRKYVTVGDEASVKIGTGKEAVSGQILSIEEAQTEGYIMLVKVDQSAGNLGDTGTVTVSKRGEARSLCVPLSALHQEDGAKYVLVCEERQTILGSERVAVKRLVEVTDSNESYAALAEGSLSDSEPVIVDSTKPVEEGDEIRLADS